MSARLLLALALCWASVADGATMKRHDVPAPLKPWVPWALHGTREPVCPSLAGQDEERNCVWPGRLALDLQAKGGKFSQAFTVYGAAGVSAWVALPGNAQRWPQSVQLNGKPAPVLGIDGAPGLSLMPGEYRVAGAFAWQALPETITIPARTGMLSLTLNGTAQPEPKWDVNGVVTLTQGERSAKPVERIDLRIARLITDDIPLTLTTRLALVAAGKNREIALSAWLPPEAIPTAISSPLPARLDADKKLVLQVRPGEWEVVVTARLPGPVKQLAAPKLEGVAEEIWAFAPRPLLRQVTLAGPPQIDPQQTSLPQDWRQYPAYRLKPGEAISFTETRRGNANQDPDQLSLTRQIWLDFDGKGYTVQDDISGSLSRSWRLSLGAPYALGRAAMGGREQLITADADKKAGIEVRVGQAQITAESRLEGSARELPAAGWSFDPQRLSTVLHLPAGWRLFAVSGVDRADGAWVSLWSLLDFFLVLVAAVAAFRLWGWRWGVATLLLLIVTWQEGGAPRWLWLNLIGAAALAHALRATRLAAWMQRYSALAWLAVVVAVVPFAVTQVRATLYPVLEAHGSGDRAGAPGAAAYQVNEVVLQQQRADEAAKLAIGIRGTTIQVDDAVTARGPVPAAAPAPEPQAKAEARRTPESAASTMFSTMESSPDSARAKTGKQTSSLAQASRLDEIDPKAVVQTGPGLPRWRWNTHQLTWNGPVDKAQTMTLWLLPPWGKVLLTLVQLALLAALLKRTLTLPAWREALPERFSGPVTALALAMVLAMPAADEVQAAAPPKPAAARQASAAGSTAQSADSADAADTSDRAAASGHASTGNYPSAELLEELRQRLTPPPPPCRPNCASIARARIETAGGELRVRLEVQAGEAAAVALPGGAKQWSPDQVLLNGKPAGTYRDGAEVLWLAVPAGVHQVLMQGRLPGRDALQLSLPMKPKRVESRLTGWHLDGVDADGVPEASLQLSRVAQTGNDKAGRDKGASGAEGNLAAFVTVERTLLLGLEWRVRTRVLRTNAPGQPVVIEYPLLPGESVLSAEVKAEGGRARVNLGPQMTELVFESALAIAPSIKLTAAPQAAWAEIWRLDAGTQWHIDLSGIPMIHQQSAGRFLPQWQPWPGESVTIAASRPAAVAGAWLTLDEARLELTPGNRVTEVALTLALRASRGGHHVLDLPPGMSLQKAVIQGVLAPLKIENNKLQLPISPGAQLVNVSLRSAQGMEWWYATPGIGLNLPGLNQHLQVNPPRERWILWFSGPRMGPAILLWGVALVLCLIGYALGRTRLTPLKYWQWMLLLLGLTQAPMLAGLLIVGWFFAVALREKWATHLSRSGWFNAAQAGMVMLTLAAALALLGAVQSTLLGLPQMQIEGNGSSYVSLRWFLDRGEFPQAQILSVPLWLWRGVMLLWALWLAWSLIGWLKWGWGGFSAGGLWRKRAAPAVQIDGSEAVAAGEAAATQAATPEATAADAASTEAADKELPK